MNTESRKFTVFLASIAALTSLSIDMSLPTVPSIEHQFGLAAGRGGLTMSLFLAGFACTPLVGGPLADRFGRRPVLLTSLACFAISALACCLSPSFAFLLTFRLIQGCAAGVSTTLPLAIVRDLLSGPRARQRMSEVISVTSTMPIVAPIFGSTIMMLGRWRIIFGAQAVFAGFIVVALLLEFNESLPPERRHRLDSANLLSNCLQLFKNNTFLGYALINGLIFASIFSFISVSPLILMQRMGVTRHTYTLLFAFIASGGIAGSVLSTLLGSRRVESHRIIVAGLWIMTAASTVAVSLQIAGFHRPIFILLPAFSNLFGFYLIGPSVTVEAVEPIPHLAGSGSGVLRSILMLFGSGTSAFLAAYCGRNFAQTEIATTLTMLVTAAAALAIYLSMRGNAAPAMFMVKS
jgi:MFS transporter, DHA1 family, multidrug resistance protein